MRTISQENYTRHVVDNYNRDAGVSGPLKKALTPAFEYEYTKELETVPGKYTSEFGRKHVGALLHLARYGRGDISFAAGVLARDIFSWRAASEKRFLRLMEYLESTIYVKLYFGSDSRDRHRLILVSSSDSDHGGPPLHAEKHFRAVHPDHRRTWVSSAS